MRVRVRAYTYESARECERERDRAREMMIITMTTGRLDICMYRYTYTYVPRDFYWRRLHCSPWQRLVYSLHSCICNYYLYIYINIYILYSLIKIYKAKMRIKRNYIVSKEKKICRPAFGVFARAWNAPATRGNRADRCFIGDIADFFPPAFDSSSELSSTKIRSCYPVAPRRVCYDPARLDFNLTIRLGCGHLPRTLHSAQRQSNYLISPLNCIRCNLWEVGDESES